MHMSLRFALTRLAVHCQLGNDCSETHRVQAENELWEYIERLENGFECSASDLTLVGVYMLRMKNRISLKHFSLRRCVLGCLVIAIKFLNDDASNSTDIHAYAGGVSLKDLCSLETEILTLLDWKVFVNESEYSIMSSYLQQLGVTQALLHNSPPLLQSPLPASIPNPQFSIFSPPTFSCPAPAPTAFPPPPPTLPCKALPVWGPDPSPSSSSRMAWPQPPTDPPMLSIFPLHQPQPPSFPAPSPDDWKNLVNFSCVDFSTWPSSVLPFPSRCQ